MGHFIRSNIQHAEIRLAPSHAMYNYSNGVRNSWSVEDEFLLARRILLEVQETNPTFTCSLIYCASRAQNRSYVASELNRAIELRRLLGNFVAGFDLVGEEDYGHSLLYFADVFLKAEE